MSNAVSADALTKIYRLYDKPSDRLLERMSFGALQRGRPFTALENVSFELEAGRSCGIIGPNGAGKSTLLKILCGTAQPTRGQCRIAGRLTALLELGAGFHPDFTGRENVRMNCSLMGFDRREIDERLEAIVEFAELGEFIDQPVRTYSSGMYVRLGFSVAAGMEPEVLIVDEALAVGDEHFRHKSMARMEAFRKDGKSILFVSHDFAAVRELCDEAIFLENGKIHAKGAVNDVTLNYLNRVHFMEEEERYAINRRSLDNAGLRFGTGEISIEEAKIEPEGTEILRPVQPAQLTIRYKVNKFAGPANFGFNIFRDDGVHCIGTNQVWSEGPLPLGLDELPQAGQTGTIRFRFMPLLLLPGEYTLSASIYQQRKGVPLPLDEVLHIQRFRVEAGEWDGPLGTFCQPGRWEIDG